MYELDFWIEFLQEKLVPLDSSGRVWYIQPPKGKDVLKRPGAEKSDITPPKYCHSKELEVFCLMLLHFLSADSAGTCL